jgi:hypothetical protein
MGKKSDDGWFSTLLKALPTGKLTAAQTGNYIGDALGIIAYGVYLLRGAPTPTLAFAGLIGILGFHVWCHSVSRPRRRDE